MHMKRGTQTLFKLSWRDKNYEHQINEVSVMFTWHFQAVYAIFIALFSTLHCTVFSSAVIQTLLTGTLPPAAAHLISGLFIFCLTNFSLTLKNRVMRVFNFLTVLCYCVDSAISDPGDGMHSENISASEMHTVLKVWMIKQMVSLTAVPPCHRGVNTVTGERRRRSARLRGMKAELNGEFMYKSLNVSSRWTSELLSILRNAWHPAGLPHSLWVGSREGEIWDDRGPFVPEIRQTAGQTHPWPERRKNQQALLCAGGGFVLHLRR